MICDPADNDEGILRGITSEEQGSPGARSLSEEFVAAGVDDLAKYHIVRLLHERPGTTGDAACYAAFLGFHSVAVTTILLDELVAAGILVKDPGEGDGPAHYRLVGDGETRRRLMRLNDATRWPLERDRVLRALASRSLAKARLRARAAAHNGHLPKSQPQAAPLRLGYSGPGRQA